MSPEAVRVRYKTIITTIAAHQAEIAEQVKILSGLQKQCPHVDGLPCVDCHYEQP